MKAIIRSVRFDDAPAILDIYAPYVLETPVTFEEIIPNVNEIVSRIEGIASQLPYLVCEMDGKVAGYAYATDFRTRAAYRWIKELSVYIHPDFRRKNIASALYSCVVNLLKYQGVTTALACITVPNPISVSFHENFGFRKVGEFEANGYKLGQWHNVGWWEMHLDSGRKKPSEQIIPTGNIPDHVQHEIFSKGEELILL
jgi:L-amino acid N-acyltransferase YncA